MTDIKLECKCLSSDAKWTLKGALNTVQLVAEGNLKMLDAQIAELSAEGKDIPGHMKLAVTHLQVDLENVKKLRDEVDRLPTCEWLKRK